jgi:hypothetical protein
MEQLKVIQKLEEEGFGVKVADCGIIAYLDSRKPSRHEIVDSVPALEGCSMGRVEAGILIQIGEERFFN